jgi:Na+-transporting NADH:ubiquinone oxidoreductase subunit C
MQRSVLYTVLFATAVCLVCGVVVSSSAVWLKPRQEANKTLDRQMNVLVAAGLKDETEKLTPDEVAARFESIEAQVIDLASGEVVPDVDPATFDQRKAAGDPDSSRPAPDNRAGVRRLPNRALVYRVLDEQGGLAKVVLPIEGKGLWSTLYGFLALEPDLNTVSGITFYEHAETPGLGGEVDNPSWKARWPGRLIYGDDGAPKLEVIKGPAGPPAEDPYRVDGLSGATLTARGVSYLVQFWLGEAGFQTYLDRLKESA